MAPDQKAITKAERALAKPKSHPMPRASFASPNPIHLPLEINQKKAKGNAINKPDRNSEIVGICK